MATFNTPYGQPTIKRVAVTVDAKQTRQTAEIRRAYFSKAQVERGEQATLNVVLRPFDKPEITKTISIPVPASTELQRELAVVVTAGSSAPADVAPPDNLNDYLNAIPKRHHSTELVILVPTTSQGLQYRGKLLKNLPASIRGVLDDSTSTDIATAADIKQIVVPTDWILSGQAAVRVPIRQE
jgi:hypothetical protein